MKKLKEKLAEEWVDGPDSEIMDTLQAHRASFLAGFKKARAMALNEVHEWILGNGEPCLNDIAVLGEEEVE